MFEPVWRMLLSYRSGNREQLRVWVDRMIESKPGELFVSQAYIGFYLLILDGVEAAMPWMEKAFESRDPGLVWPAYFHRPLRYSNDSAWLAFWSKPELKKLLELQATFSDFPDAGYWLTPDSDAGPTKPGSEP